MTDLAPPFSRPVPVEDLPPEGRPMTVVPTEAERAAIAELLDIPAVRHLVATFRLTPKAGGAVELTGKVEGHARQTCVVSLEEIDEHVKEDVLVRFDPEAVPIEEIDAAELEAMIERGEDPPDPLVGGIVDLGVVATEFFALGLDPYPRKPGVEFVPPAEAEEAPPASPFAALSRWKGE